MRWLLPLCLLACDDAADGAGSPDPVDMRVVDATLDATPSDAGPDATGADARVAPRDAGTDAALDAAVDAAVDAVVDAAPDAAPDAEPDSGIDGPICGRYSGATRAGTLAGTDLAEVSGIAASRQRPGVFWMHNDSGNAPLLYAVTAEGAPRGHIELPADLDDLEDVAVARCPASERWCIWAADTGDNREDRESVSLVIVPEPPLPADADAGLIVVDGIQRLTLRYPDGPVDVEALAVAPEGDRFWLFSKVEDGQTTVFAGVSDDPRQRVVEAARFDAPGVAVPMGRMVTGADLHPDGRRLVLRVYTGSYEYLLGDAGIAAIGERPARQIVLGPLSEPQGEAIAYGADGQTVWTVSEAPAGDQPIHRYDCLD